MADETKTAIDAAADAAKATVEAAGDAANQASATVASTSRRAARTATKTTKRQGKAARATAKTERRAKPRRTTRKPRKTAAAAQERIETVTNTNFFNGFAAVPGFAPFQSLFADAGDRGQEAVRRSQKAVEELADLSRANVEALVDAGKIAIEGARAIGQDVVETSRDGVEQTADAVRALAEAKSPTEFIQVQTEFARASFDRFVSESSRLTESVVKLAGEAFQPISTRATLNAERVNKLVA
jgi:phasin family protein